ncbi:MAG: HlyD family efflux transporter periplasmic adaptor subunit [Chitinophagaceae bacterium]
MNRLVAIGSLLLVMQNFFSSCHSPAAAPEEAAPAVVQTPVTITNPLDSSINDYVELNAVSSFLQKNYIKANANGYLQSNFTQPGQYVNKGQVLFTVKTKEAESIGNAVNQLDSGFHFKGTNGIKAGENGFITQLNHQAGDYVQDGEQLAVVSDVSSFVFLLDLPYELRPYLASNKSVVLELPDGEKLSGVLAGGLPSVDPTSQTQSMMVRVKASHTIPENLIAKVKIYKTRKPNAISLPKTALLSDETQSSFWIMKMIDSTTAVKVEVEKGIETKDRVEIVSPKLQTTDQILLSGNYGLADTAKVKIIP